MKRQSYKKFAFFYDAVYRGRFYRDYADFITKIIKEKWIKNPLILDIACGTGSLVKILRKKYWLIEGLDNSKEMLAIAKEKNEGVTFYNQNMIDFNTGKKYDIIVCTFDSINYITDKRKLQSFFKNLSDHLGFGGIFIFDFNTTSKKIAARFTNGRVTFLSKIKGKFWDVSLEIREDKNIHREIHRERLYSLLEMKSALKKNKLKIIGMYSNFNKKINSADKHGRIFIVVSKES